MEKSNGTPLQRDHPSSRYTNNLTFFISSIIIFIFIIGAIVSVSFMLKLDIESQSLSANPSKAIRDVCYSFHYFDLNFVSSSSWLEEQELMSKIDSQKLCFDSISTLHSQNYTNRISLSMIFHLSLQVSVSEIKNLRNEPALRENCNKLLNNSESEHNISLTSMGVDPSDSMLRDEKLVNDMRSRIKNASDDLEECLMVIEKRFVRVMGEEDELVLKINISKAYLGNCLGILNNLDKIFGLFYPSIGTALGVDFSYMTATTFSSILFFCSQYLMLIIIVGVFLHVWRRN